MLTAILIALQLSACGGGTEGTETVTEDPNEALPGSGAEANAWNNVNEDLRGDILSFGHKGTEAELEGATVVLRGYLSARASRNFSKACSYMSEFLLAVSKGTARRQDGGGCAAGAESLAGLSSTREVEGEPQIDPSSIRRGGKRTFVIYEDGYGDIYAMLMRREEDGWKIHGFEPTRLW
ncbi:MAG TPA: hypothetical protein VFW48_10200 [Solirubrobacterales bacterium]|nr:hypothetical protein [Solirubrobacterales bacterium]